MIHPSYVELMKVVNEDVIIANIHFLPILFLYKSNTAKADNKSAIDNKLIFNAIFPMIKIP